MKRKFITIPFGKKEKRVRIVLCRKVMAKGLAGMIRGRCLPRDLAILIDNTSPEKAEYLHAALVGSGDTVFAVQLTPAVFHGIRRGDAMARTCLFHELGHFVCKHLEEPGFQTENYDTERYRLASEGKVMIQELEADAFAADYLGHDLVADGLSAIRCLHEESLASGVCSPEEVTVAMQELDNRIGALKEKSTIVPIGYQIKKFNACRKCLKCESICRQGAISIVGDYYYIDPGKCVHSMLLKRDLALFEKMMPKIQENPRLYQLVQNYYESGSKILPIVISGSNTSLTQAFLLSLQRTLSEHDFLSAMPDTNYRAAINVIHRWGKDFPETFTKFQEAIDEPVNVLIDRLENYDVGAYETFERIYPTLTAGSVFNPFLGFDVVELYESVAKSIKPMGYTGLYVVYDEFSKFLEANIVDASVSDTKMLQDFAEKCCRSGTLQLHLMLISHKEISNYIDKLPKEKTDGWRGVSERFKHIHMNNNFAQTYEIISSVIQHEEPRWRTFCNAHALDFEALFTRYRKHQMFTDAQGEIETAIKGCFPLHPVSTFILPRLSERVAQNERTLFTFLSAEGTATLASFLDVYENDFTLVTPDQIYDYFEPLFKKEVYAGGIHDTFVLTSAILNQIPEGPLGSKIVKTISLIYILEQYERLSPTKEQIIGIYSGSYDVDEIERAITDLIEKEFVVYIKRSNDYLRLKQTSGVDIQQKIHDQMEAQTGRVTAKDVLNSANFDNYMYPSRYNDDRGMTRFFYFQFIDGSEIADDVDWDIKGEHLQSDGVIYGIIPNTEDQLKEISDIVKKTSKGFNRFIFVLPKHFREIDGVIREYAAVKQLRDQATDDPVLFDEYEVVFEDLQEVINGFISSFTHPENYRSVYYHDGEIINVRRKSSLTEVMSQICDRVFGLTPVINNESVNKNEITSIAANSRNKIISALLRNELEPNLGLSGTGQEVSIMRSTLLRTGIWNEEGGIPQLNLHPDNAAMRNMLETIESFVLEARQNGRISFSVLYNRLTSPDYHIGLRSGVIPIYVAVVMHNYRHQVVISDRFGSVQTNVDTLVQINSEPSYFSIEYLDWNPEKEDYIARLAFAFSDYVIEAEKAGSSYDYVANAMRRWYMALPKFSKECKVRPNGIKIGKVSKI